MGLLTPGEIKQMAGLIHSQANATVTKLEQPGGLDTHGDPSHVTRWEGTAKALLDRDERTVGAGVQHVDTLTVIDDVAPVIEKAGPVWIGWRITVSDERADDPVIRTFRITNMNRDAWNLIDSIELDLEGQA